MRVRRIANGEERQLLLRKTLQREPSPLLDIGAATERKTSREIWLPWAGRSRRCWVCFVPGLRYRSDKKMLCKY